MHLGEVAIQVDLGFSPVHLGLPRVMVQGDHYLSPRPDLPDVLPDGRFSTGEAKLRYQTIIDAVSSVALLGRPVLIPLQPLVDDGHEWGAAGGPSGCTGAGRRH